jgi:hypothetical protein
MACERKLDASPMDEPAMRLSPHLFWRQRALAAATVAAYSEWRSECAAVRASYRRWVGARGEQEQFAFSAYRSALDREEHAAKRYARLMRRTGHLEETGVVLPAPHASGVQPTSFEHSDRLMLGARVAARATLARQTVEDAAEAGQMMSSTTRTPSVRLDQVVNDAVLAYVDWREASAAVWDAYWRWESAAGSDHVCAHAAYLAAVDQEEAAANAYAELIGRAAVLLAAAP